MTCGMLCRVTGKGYMDVNRISGYIPGKIVFFLMQVRVAETFAALYHEATAIMLKVVVQCRPAYVTLHT